MEDHYQYGYDDIDKDIVNHKPVKYRRPWKDAFKEAAESFAVGLAFLAAIVLFVSALVGAITLVLEVSWLFIFPIAAIIFIIMVLAKRFDP